MTPDDLPPLLRALIEASRPPAPQIDRAGPDDQRVWLAE